jgi:hypothetical protein
MGVLYEHWRPDLNECFYVGVSWTQEDTRPYTMKDRNYRHMNVQEELATKGLSPEVRLVECSHLSREDLGEFERLQIDYWRDLIGDRLTNIAKGGRGIDVIWDDELRERASNSKNDFYSSEEGDIWRREQSVARQEFLASEEGKEWQKRQTKKRQDFMDSPEGQAMCDSISESWRAFLSTPEGEVWRKNQSATKKAFYETPEGELWRKENSERNTGENHPNSNISKEIAQEVLDFVGTHAEASRKFNIPYGNIQNIRNRVTWRHLTPSKPELKHVIDGRVKLTGEIAQKILDFSGTHREAAEKFCVNYSTVRDIRNRNTWRNLTPAKDKAG